jgi:PPOX class probable F420-dependent enzyme
MGSEETLHMSPVFVAIDEIERLTISSQEGSVITTNLERDPRIWICVVRDEFFGEWMRADGHAEIVRLPDAVELLVDHYRRIGGDHPEWDRYRAAMGAERRVLIRVEVERVAPDIVA